MSRAGALLREGAAACASGLRAGAVTAADLLAASLARLDAVDGAVGAVLARTGPVAAAAAEAADARLRAEGDAAPLLCGVPVGLKDVLCLEGVPATAGSRILEGFVPPYSATAVHRLLDAGAVPVAKLNCDEFAMGSSNENSAYHPVGNPWDTGRVPGGSSGGSAAAVAAGMVPLSLGSDTGGSIRQPASLCGVVGFKPTYGRVSRYGLIAFASSLDQIGPFAHSVEDAALTYATIAGFDERDSTSLREPVGDVAAELRRGVEGLRLGVPREYFGEGLEAGVRERVEAAIDALRGLGAEPREISLPTTDAALSAYYIVAPAECSSNLARYDGVRFGMRDASPSLLDMYRRSRGRGFGAEVKRRVMLGTYALSSGYYDAYYRRAQRVRTVIAREFEQAFAGVDAIVCPTSPTVAFPMGARADPIAMYLCDALTIPVNLAGLPAISVPCGLAGGLPVGLQVIGPRLGDAVTFRVAAAYEAATEWHDLRAPLGEVA